MGQFDLTIVCHEWDRDCGLLFLYAEGHETQQQQLDEYRTPMVWRGLRGWLPAHEADEESGIESGPDSDEKDSDDSEDEEEEDFEPDGEEQIAELL